MRWVVPFVVGVGVSLVTLADAEAAEVPVANAAELAAAIANAAPGDEIVLAPGTYVFSQKLSCATEASADQPIIVRAGALGEAKIQFDTVEGFHVQASHWQFERLEIEGVCAVDDDCEHAFHVTGDAEFTWIHHNRAYGFNAHIKANGTDTGPNGERVWPDDVVVEYNEFYNPSARATDHPVTFIDVVGGRRWQVRGNYLHDFAKAGGDTVSYAAFLKGNSRDGLFERNLVVCEQLHTGQVRLGLSFGGGGSGPDNICEDAICSPEHQGGTMRNNIIAHCPADVGIYVNEGADSRIYNNTLYRTSGIDMRFVASTGEVRNNLLTGQIRNRDGATANFASNLAQVSEGEFQAWFVDPDALDFSLAVGGGAAFVDLGESLAEVVDDYCANIRDDGSHDLGALEYDGDGTCDTSQPFEPGDGDGDPGTGDGDGDGDGDATTGDGDGDPTTGDGDGDPSTGDGDGDPTTGDDGGTGTDDAGASGDEAQGCACTSDEPGPGAPWAWAVAALGLGVTLRRRRD